MNPKLIKHLLIGGGVLAGTLLILWIVLKIVDALGKTDLEKKLKKELDDSNLTLPESKYEQIATGLRVALEGWLTDEESVYRNLELLNTADDWRKVNLVFGSPNNKNLVMYLNDDLDNDEKAKVNEILKKFNESF